MVPECNADPKDRKEIANTDMGTAPIRASPMLVITVMFHMVVKCLVEQDHKDSKVVTNTDMELVPILSHPWLVIIAICHVDQDHKDHM